MGLSTAGADFLPDFNTATSSTSSSTKTTTTTDAAGVVTKTVSTSGRASFATAFANAYSTHAKAGVCPAITVSATGKAGLETEILALGSSSTQVIIDLATALVNFWFSEVTGKAGSLPATSDAKNYQSGFETAIKASVTTVSGTLPPPSTVTGGAFTPFLVETDKIVNKIIYKDWEVNPAGGKLLLTSGSVT